MNRSNRTTGTRPTENDREPQPATSPLPAANQQDRERQFKLENTEAFASMNAWVEEHGLPLAKHRQF